MTDQRIVSNFIVLQRLTMLFKNLFIQASLAVLAHAKVNLHSLKQCGNFDSEKKTKHFHFLFHLTYIF